MYANRYTGARHNRRRMFIFNTTFNVEEHRTAEWQQWMHQHYIPLHMATGLFAHYVFSRVLIDEELGGISYSLQLYAPTRQALDQYTAQHQARVEQHLIDAFRGHYVQFQLVLEQLAP